MTHPKDTEAQGAAHTPQHVSSHYIAGIQEGRASFKAHGMSISRDEITNLSSTIKGFSASGPVGQMLRGERDFWANQIKRAATGAQTK